MTSFLGPTYAIVRKELLLEFRSHDVTISVLVFAIAVVVVFSFAFNPTPGTVALLVPGMIWVVFMFSGILAINRSFILEKDRGTLEGLLLCPVDSDVIYFGKFMASLLFMFVIELFILPVIAILFDAHVLTLELIVVLALTTVGFAAIGTLFSAMAVNTRSREVMLPLMLLPIVIPLMVAAVEASRELLNGESWGNIARWLQLIALFDIIFLVVAPRVFGYVTEE